MATQIEWKIVSGPSKWNLMLALFDDDDRVRQRTVKFTLKDSRDHTYTGRFVVRGVERKSQESEEWSIKGEFTDQDGETWYPLDVCYSTKSRRGEFILLDP